MRPEGWTKSGYYPTPPRVTELITSKLRISTHRGYADYLDILDPCAGEGHVLLDLKKHLLQRFYTVSITTHAVELNQARADTAKLRVDHVVNEDVENIRLEPNSSALLWLNPPYDWDADNRTDDSIRLESGFLHLATTSLIPNGILVYIVPEEVITHDAGYLATNYVNPQIWRFPEPEYQDYRQCVFIGARRRVLNDPYNATARELRQIHQIMADGPDPLDVPAAPHERVFIPSSPAPAGQIITPRDLHRHNTNLAASHGLWTSDSLISQITPNFQQAKLRPLEQMPPGLIMLMVAAGALDNVRLQPDDQSANPIIIRGTTSKAQHQDKQTGRTVTTETFVNTIQVTDLATGVTTSLNAGEPEQMTAFIQAYSQPLLDSVKRLLPPSIDPTAPRYADYRRAVARSLPPPIGKQAYDAVTIAARLDVAATAFLIGEQGSGKTVTATAVAKARRASRVIVTMPSHIIEQWERQIRTAFPYAKVRVVTSIAPVGVSRNDHFRDLTERYRDCDVQTALSIRASPESPVWILLPQYKARTSYFVRPSYRRITSGQLYRLHDPKTGASRLRILPYPDPDAPEANPSQAQPAFVTRDTCPGCWTMLDGDKHHARHQSERNYSCPQCSLRLNSPDVQTLITGKHLASIAVRNIPTPPSVKPRNYPLADFISRHHPHWSDLTIVDELHQYKSGNSAQGDVIGRLAQRSRKVLAMTGTIMGGYASDLFYILQRFKPGFSETFPWRNRRRFAQAYGRIETTTYHGADSDLGQLTGAQSSRRQGKSTTRERPGYHPRLLVHLLDCSVITTQDDLRSALPQTHPARSLPPPHITPIIVPLDTTLQPAPPDQPDGPPKEISHASAYHQLSAALMTDVRSRIQSRQHLHRAISNMQHILSTYPENAWQGIRPSQPDRDVPIADLPPLDRTRLYPKELQLLRIIAQEYSESRQAIIYCTHNHRLSTVERVHQLLTDHGYHVAIMDSIPPRRRSHWFATTSADAVIVHPKAVETGLNLLAWPTIIWYEIEYSMLTVEQASMRSARINQPLPIRIYYLAYADTIQQRALELVAAKADAARLVYGRLTANGLSAMNRNDDSMAHLIETELYRSFQDQRTLLTSQADQQAKHELQQIQAELQRQFHASQTHQDLDPSAYTGFSDQASAPSAASAEPSPLVLKSAAPSESSTAPGRPRSSTEPAAAPDRSDPDSTPADDPSTAQPAAETPAAPSTGKTRARRRTAPDPAPGQPPNQPALL